MKPSRCGGMDPMYDYRTDTPGPCYTEASLRVAEKHTATGKPSFGFARDSRRRYMSKVSKDHPFYPGPGQYKLPSSVFVSGGRWGSGGPLDILSGEKPAGGDRRQASEQAKVQTHTRVSPHTPQSERKHSKSVTALLANIYGKLGSNISQLMRMCLEFDLDNSGEQTDYFLSVATPHFDPVRAAASQGVSRRWSCGSAFASSTST